MAGTYSFAILLDTCKTSRLSIKKMENSRDYTLFFCKKMPLYFRYYWAFWATLMCNNTCPLFEMPKIRKHDQMQSSTSVHRLLWKTRGRWLVIDITKSNKIRKSIKVGASHYVKEELCSRQLSVFSEISSNIVIMVQRSCIIPVRKYGNIVHSLMTKTYKLMSWEKSDK